MNGENLLSITSDVLQIVIALGVIVGAIAYFLNGQKSRPRERAELFSYAILGIIALFFLYFLYSSQKKQPPIANIPTLPQGAIIFPDPPSTYTPAITEAQSDQPSSISTNNVPLVHAQPPSTNDLSIADQNNIWLNALQGNSKTTGFFDAHSPGLYEYYLDISRQDRKRLGFLWCEADDQRLEDVLNTISTPRFFINGQEISRNFFKPEWFDAYGQSCYRFSTMLTKWQPGNVQVEMLLMFDKVIEEDGNNYQPGEYRHVIYVNVN